MIVAVLIFGRGGGVLSYEGVQHIRHPEPMHDPLWNHIVLGTAGTAMPCFGRNGCITDTWRPETQKGLRLVNATP